MPAFALSLLLSLFLFFTSCGSSSGTSSAPGDTPQPEPTQPLSPYHPDNYSKNATDYDTAVTTSIANATGSDTLVIWNYFDQNADGVPDMRIINYHDDTGTLIKSEQYNGAEDTPNVSMTHTFTQSGSPQTVVTVDQQGKTTSDEEWEYDASGLLLKHITRHLDIGITLIANYSYSTSANITTTTETLRSPQTWGPLYERTIVVTQDSLTSTLDIYGDGTIDAETIRTPSSPTEFEVSYDGDMNVSFGISTDGELIAMNSSTMDGIIDKVERHELDMWGNPESIETDAWNDGSIDTITSFDLRSDGQGAFLVVMYDDMDNDGEWDSIVTTCYARKQ